MATAKSPFLIFQDFLSAKICEQIVDDLGFYTPDTNDEEDPIKMFRHHEPSQKIIWERYEPLIDGVMGYYDAAYRGTEMMTFEYLAEGTASEPLCENSNYVNKKWLRVRDRDITSLLFLSDYNDQPPFDNEFEVYGGKFEFPQHGFGFNPQRGTLIFYPSGPHFINANATIIAGDLFQVRFHIATKLPYLYNPLNFPGDFRSWFRHLS